MAKTKKRNSHSDDSMKQSQTPNGDRDCTWTIGKEQIHGLGSFHKTLPHNCYGEVCPIAFKALKDAANNKVAFSTVPAGPERHSMDGTFKLTNPQAGLADDQLIHNPKFYKMPPAPKVTSETIAAEMTELYWMALLRDVPFNELNNMAGLAAKEINEKFSQVLSPNDYNLLHLGIDVPGSAIAFTPFTSETLFRLGLPGDDVGPMVSQFFVRPVEFGTQTIDTRQYPYKAGHDYLVEFDDWLKAQNSGKDAHGQGYNEANEDRAENFEADARYISTMRDLARFVNKDALHQAYFNAALLMLSGGADWTPGNPYVDKMKSSKRLVLERESGFGVLGGPHILALVSEVATRALKVVWNQKWQVHLRLRPEAYGGLVHVQEHGVEMRQADMNPAIVKRAYGLPAWVAQTEAAKKVQADHGSYLLPMAFTPGSPAHPAYGAGHATVAGACVTILKAYFATFDEKSQKPILFNTLLERDSPHGARTGITPYLTGKVNDAWGRFALSSQVAKKLTIEGELNKLAQNVAMGRSMGGVHWRTDNTRSLVLGEALAAEILCDITRDAEENPCFTFRTFARDADGKPKKVIIENGTITVNGNAIAPPVSYL